MDQRLDLLKKQEITVEKLYTIKCVGGFRDGNAYPRAIANNEVLEGVTEREYRRLVQSDPNCFEVLDVVHVVPPPTKDESAAEKEAKKVADEEAKKAAEEEAIKKAMEEAEKKAMEEADRKAKKEAEKKSKEAEKKAKKEAKEAEKKAKKEAKKKPGLLDSIGLGKKPEDDTSDAETPEAEEGDKPEEVEGEPEAETPEGESEAEKPVEEEGSDGNEG